MTPIRLVTVAPGHFHAALVQKRRVVGVEPRSYVYGPLDGDIVAHLERIAAFNNRPDSPTDWELDLRSGENWKERFKREMPGNVVVLSGRNKPKIELMKLAVEACANVLADKPWVIEYGDFPRLEELYDEAALREVFLFDVMTERHEITNRLQRALVSDPRIFGNWQVGTPARPALRLESVHHFRKLVSGKPLIRPWWWFETSISGESLADVGTHLADLALQLIAPDHSVDYRKDITHLSAEARPLLLSKDEFQAVTGLQGYPRELLSRVVHEQLYYAGSNRVTFLLHGVHVDIATRWEFEAPHGGSDTHFSAACGTKAIVEVRQGPGEAPLVFARAVNPESRVELLRLLGEWCAANQQQFPGIAAWDLETEVQLLIPDSLRTGHEEHFAAVLQEFVGYLRRPRSVPSWERANTIAKYFITTKAVKMAREAQIRG